MHTTDDMNYFADGPRAFALDRYYFALECAKAFRHMKRIVFRDSVRRLVGRLVATLRGQSSTLRGQSWRGRRSTDARKTISIPLDGIDGYIESDGRIANGRKAFSARLLPRWRALLEKGGASSMPPPRAYRLNGKWYLESGAGAAFALEAAYALGETEIRVAVPLLALEAVAGSAPGSGSRSDRAA